MQAVWALATKDIRLLLRDKAGFFFTFGFPILFAIMFGSIFSGAGGGDDDGGETSAIPVVVVDEDGTDDSRQFIATLESSDELAIDVAADRAAAEDLVRRGRRTAFLVIAEGYEKAGEQMFWGEPARLEVGVDPSRGAEAGMLQGILMKYAFQRMQTMFTDFDGLKQRADVALDAVMGDAAMEAETQGPLSDFLRSLRTFADAMPETGTEAGSEGESDGGASETGAGWQPVEIAVTKVTGKRKRGAGPPNAFAISFPQATIWGVMGCAAAFGISLVVERTHGTLVRLRTAPITLRQILLGKAAACFLVTTIVVTALLLIAVTAFGVRPGWAAVPRIALAVVCVAVAFVGIMMLLSVVGRTEAAAGGIGWAVLIVMAMLGGGMIPLFLMPAWMSNVASVSPVKWSILAMEGALWRGYSYAEMLLPCGILLAVGLGGFLGGTAVFRRTAGG